MRFEPRPIVVDASVAIPFVIDEVGSRRVEQALRVWEGNGVGLAVPSFFWLEVVNVLAHGPRIIGADALAAVHRLDELGFETYEVDRSLLVLTIDRIERFSLTAYDAVYLALAEQIDGSLATIDRRLFAAAGDRGLWMGEGSVHRLSETAAAYGESRPTWPDYSGAAAFLSKLRADARKDLESLGR